jgi:hypothetical protein
MTLSFTPLALFALLGLGACSPVLDWREFKPEGSGIGVSFPCRPDRQTRVVTLAETRVTMQMLICSAGDATFALAYADLTDPARINMALAELRAFAVSNLGGDVPERAPLQIKGMTSSEEAGRMTLVGRLPDGATVHEHAALFTRGLRVYQATVIGADPAASVVDAFMAGLKFPG